MTRSAFCAGADERKARNLAENPSCILTTGRSDLSGGALDVVLEGQAEQVADNGELEPIAEAFATKYGTDTWDFVVRDGAFNHRGADVRALVFRVRPVRGLVLPQGRSVQPDNRAFPG